MLAALESAVLVHICRSLQEGLKSHEVAISSQVRHKVHYIVPYTLSHSALHGALHSVLHSA